MPENKITAERVMLNEYFSPFMKGKNVDFRQDHSQGNYSREFFVDGIGYATVVLVDRDDYDSYPGHFIVKKGSSYSVERFEKLQPELSYLSVNLNLEDLSRGEGLVCELKIGEVCLSAVRANMVDEETFFYSWRREGDGSEGEDLNVINYDPDFLRNLQVRFVKS